MDKIYGKQYYQNNLISNYQRYEDNPYFEALLQFILKFKKEGDFLELGCAYGFLLKKAENSFNTYGIDISEYAIKKAKKITKKSVLKSSNIEKGLTTLFDEKKFDVIIALDVLEHTNNPKKIIGEIKDILKDDGIFVYRVPNTDAMDYLYYSLINKKKWHGNRDKTHKSLYKLKEWETITASSGFDFKLQPYFPTKIMKKIIAKNFPKLFFLPSFFTFTNKSITFFCTKKR